MKIKKTWYLLSIFFTYQPLLAVIYNPAAELTFLQNMFGPQLEYLPLASSEMRSQKNPSAINKKLPWTVIIYMAADNDLREFSISNIRQMAQIGSNKNLHIAIHLDTTFKREKITRRFYIEKNKLWHLNPETTTPMDSGSPNTLISCCDWAIKNFPAEHYALIIWNHGTGCLEPNISKGQHIRSSFLSSALIDKKHIPKHQHTINTLTACMHRTNKGMCWDSSTGHYITNQQLQQALHTICSEQLNGEKLDIIGFDTCLMAMIEVTHAIKDYAQIMVCSQEVELGAGWNYTKVLQPFIDQIPTTLDFARHIVTVYKEAYSRITKDYTLSALDLSQVNMLLQNIERLALLLLNDLKSPDRQAVAKWISRSRNRLLCATFDEPSYADLGNIYSNLLDGRSTNPLSTETKKTLRDGLIILGKLIIANEAGRPAPRPTGLSIYFPERKINPSYADSSFARQNQWYQLLITQLKQR